MKTALILLPVLLVTAAEALGQQGTTVGSPAAVLRLAEAEQAREIAIYVTVDDIPYDQYWQRTFDAIFAFADVNSDGMLDDREIRLVPSARAVRLSLGSGFTPPVASVQSIHEIVAGDAPNCSKPQLTNYYLRHGAGRVVIGCGRLSNTAAITNALLRALDEDQDGNLSEAELLRAETRLQRLDTNDDELIGVGELVPSGTYPGNWASHMLQPTASIDVSSAAARRSVLTRLQVQAAQTGSSSTITQQSVPRQNGPRQLESAAPNDRTTWQIKINDQVRDLPFKLNTLARCESWSVGGALKDLYAELRSDLTDSIAAPANEAVAIGDRRPAREWLATVVDRNGDGTASPQEVEQWLALQQQLIHGQLLISVYHGGGLFELLDTNHDAGLSTRELRSAWRNLQSGFSTPASQVDLTRLPDVLLFVVSQGYPTSLARTKTSEVEWFRRMDRNADGDVSRREFTGSPAAFSRFDKDRDGLIAPSEASDSK